MVKPLRVGWLDTVVMLIPHTIARLAVWPVLFRYGEATLIVRSQSSNRGPRFSTAAARISLVAVTLGALTGCVASVGEFPSNGSAQRASNSGRWLNGDGISAEYKAEVSNIPEPLPSGRGYPEDIPKQFRDIKQHVLEKGLGVNQAWYTWLCAWENQYLANTQSESSAGRRQLAEQMIAKWPSMSFYKTVVDDPDHGWPRNVVEPMKIGNSAGVRQDFDQTCEGYPSRRLS